ACDVDVLRRQRAGTGDLSGQYPRLRLADGRTPADRGAACAALRSVAPRGPPRVSLTQCSDQPNPTWFRVSPTGAPGTLSPCGPAALGGGGQSAPDHPA